jgi:SAM-dependent methyltransferase
MFEEMLRVVRPGGIAFLAFTNWWSPFGGHETSPWHWLGAERAVRRYERRHGEPPKNRYGRSLFRLHIHEVLSWARDRPDATLIEAFPRYYPWWTRRLAGVPVVREVATWNLAIAMRKH